MESASVEMANAKEEHVDVVCDYDACKKEEDAKDEDEPICFIQISEEKTYHLSDVNLLRSSYVIAKEDLEVTHTHAEHQAVANLANQIFNEWDLAQDGVISVEEIEDSGLDKDFAAGLGRVLDCANTGQICCEDLVNCLTILTYGTMKAKVALLVNFMDRNGDLQLSVEEIQTFLMIAPLEICERLGLVDGEGTTKNIYYEDILALFEASDRGQEAMSIFCKHIMSILMSRLRTTASTRFAPSAVCFGTKDVYQAFTDLWGRLTRLPLSALFIAAMIALQIVLWEYNFNYYQKHGYPLSFCIAKGFGLNLRILTLLLFFTMARTTMAHMYGYKILKWFIPMGFNIQLHSFIGFCTVLHALGHTAGHIVYHTHFVDGGFGHAFVQPSLLRGAKWPSKGSGDGITGVLLLGSLLIMACTALHRGSSSRAYKTFSAAHLLYNFWLIFLFLHVPHLWMYFFAIGCLMILDRGYDFFRQTTHSTLEFSRPCSNGVTFLSVPRASPPSYPGAYYRIKVPALSVYEWHPFSLASNTSSHHLTFFVASTGDWTRQLHALVSDRNKRNAASVQVQGPFYAPAHTAVKKPTSTILMVASGIGITPFFSVMATRVAEEQSYESDKEVYASLFKENLVRRGGGSTTTVQVLKTPYKSPVDSFEVKVMRVVWSIRDVTELMFYLDYVYELVKHQSGLQRPVIEVDVYLTGIGNQTDITYMISQTLFLLSLASKTSEYMRIHFGRPNLESTVDSIGPDKVYYCGGKALKETLNDLCAEKKIPFHPEDFDSGTHVLKDVSTFFSSLLGRTPRQQVEKARVIKRKKSMGVSKDCPVDMPHQRYHVDMWTTWAAMRRVGYAVGLVSN